MFHYYEICNKHKEIERIRLDRLDSIETSLQAFYLLVDSQKGSKLIEHLNDIRLKKVGVKRDKTNNKNIPNGDSQTVDGEVDLLNDVDKELWSFMETQPKVIKETQKMKNVGRHILPTVNKKDIIKNNTVIVEKVDKKPNLGFKGW